MFPNDIYTKEIANLFIWKCDNYILELKLYFYILNNNFF